MHTHTDTRTLSVDTVSVDYFSFLVVRGRDHTDILLLWVQFSTTFRAEWNRDFGIVSSLTVWTGAAVSSALDVLLLDCI